MEADPEVGGDSAGVSLEVSPRKRQKTLEISPSKTPSRKGKEKIETGEDDTGGSRSCICGICLSEDRKANRGVINCCDHYFCFVCIMEWAKVESRCPMCKQRFASIWRPTRHGSCLQERLVDIPVRDQASRNEAESVDLYANIHCTICKLSDDESVLLLCDLCDSAAHTYCVGLRNTVPEGDWYCNDCMISRNEHSNNDIQCDSLVGNLSANVEIVTADQEDDLIFEIVKDERSLQSSSQSEDSAQSYHTESCKDEPTSLESSSSQPAQSNNTESCKASIRETTRKHLKDPSRPRKSTLRKVVADLKIVLPSARPRTSDHRARTLSRCRRLHQHIKALRKNWNALQTGSLSFSRFFDSGTAENMGRRQKAPLNIYKGSQKEVTPISAQNVASNIKVSYYKETSGSGYDVDRAWRMMAMAKTLSHCPPSNSGNSSKGSKSLVTREQPLARKMVCAVENGTLSADINGKTCITKNLESKRCTVNKNSYVNKDVFGSWSNISVGYCDPSSTHVPLSPTVNVRNMDKDSNSQLHEKVTNIHIESLEYDDQSILVSNLCHTELKAERSSVGKEESSDSVKALRASRVNDESAVKRYEADKHQIQSLVKLNLKLLTRGKQLGLDRFKEVGRIATHTVLAACGLEHSKSIVRPFSKLHCNHAIRLEGISSLMPGCCRECFSFFIQDIVRTILSEKA